MKKILVILSVILLTACSSLRKNEIKNQKFSETDAKNWDKIISKEIEKSAYIPDLYGNENPVYYLRKTGKMTNKQFTFLSELSKKEKLTDQEVKEFNKLVKKYPSKINRSFYLEDKNFKNPKGLVDKMVSDSYLRTKTPSSHILKNVATKEEWMEIVNFSKQKDLSEKDIKKLKKLLNKFIKRVEFFDKESWYGAEVSDRVERLVILSKSGKKSRRQINNINAKALYVAYPNYFSPLENWGK